MTRSAYNTNQPQRCAIYTRKSSEAGLEQSFNSLQAQREACEAYIKSQAHEGWKLRPTQYDDGGLSGGSMDRPALHHLITDIRNGLIDIVVVYKVDRLSRSLADFARLVELFEQHSVSFVSVTQHFNTSSSMGRLTLNVLLSFAQFEREVTGERIRDKIAASKQKGMWMGGRIPIGYDVVDKQLIVNDREARTVQHIYGQYQALGCVRLLKGELDAAGFVSKIHKNGDGGKPFSRGALYTLLRNPIYIGKISHKGKIYPGRHQPILSQQQWDQVQDQLRRNRSQARQRSAAKAPSLLAGMLFDSNGHPMSPTHATKGQKRYRYYISQAVLKYVESEGGSILRVPAENVESVVENKIRQLFRNSTRIAQIFQQFNPDSHELERVLVQADKVASRWQRMQPHEKIRLLNQAVTRIVLSRESIDCKFNPIGILRVLIPGYESAFTDDQTRGDELVVSTSVQLKRCGVETRLIVSDGSDQPAHPDSVRAIQKALENAHMWNQELLNGEIKTLTELARKEGRDPRYLFDLMQLAWLAPQIQHAIHKGAVPADLTLEKLKKKMPASWDDQRLILGFTA